MTNHYIEHNEDNWRDSVKVIIHDILDARVCSEMCPEVRALKEENKSIQESLKMLWKKIDWIYIFIITTLLGICGELIGIIMIWSKLK